MRQTARRLARPRARAQILPAMSGALSRARKAPAREAAACEGASSAGTPRLEGLPVGAATPPEQPPRWGGRPIERYVYSASFAQQRNI